MVDRNAYQKQRYLDLRAAGLCGKGCGNEAEPGKSLCRECRNKNLARNNSRKARAVAAGLCPACGTRPMLPRLKTCSHCLRAARQRQAGKVRQALAAGLCRFCQRRPILPGMAHCALCLSGEKNRRRRRKIFVMDQYGGPVCTCCGETILEFLTMDHVNGDGATHRRSPVSRNALGPIYAWLKSHGFPPGFQVLCFNCNVGRHINGGVCPHQAQKKPI